MRNFIKKGGIKWLVILTLIVLLGICAIFDAMYKNVYTLSYSYRCVKKDDTEYEGDLIEAYKIYITVHVERNGKPVAGHYIWMENPTQIDRFDEIVSAGSLKQNQIKSDENGNAVFEYFPYKVNKFKPADVVNFEAKDLDGSIIIEMYIGIKFDIDLRGTTENEWYVF